MIREVAVAREETVIDRITPFKTSKNEPVLRLDEMGKRAAARHILAYRARRLEYLRASFDDVDRLGRVRL